MLIRYTSALRGSCRLVLHARLTTVKESISTPVTHATVLHATSDMMIALHGPRLGLGHRGQCPRAIRTPWSIRSPVPGLLQTAHVSLVASSDRFGPSVRRRAGVPHARKHSESESSQVTKLAIAALWGAHRLTNITFGSCTFHPSCMGLDWRLQSVLGC